MRIILWAGLILLIIKGVNKVETSRVIEYDTYDKLYTNLERAGMKFPRVFVAQMLLETGYLTSKIYKENNNLVGMKASSRNKEEKNGHAAYSARLNSIIDYIAWQKKVFKLCDKEPSSEEEYLDLLNDLPFRKGSRYAEDIEYTTKLRKILKELP